MPENSEVQTGSNEASSALKTLNLEVLKLIKESQQQHGLRHADYQRYRFYCSRRVRRLRKTLHLLCGNVKKYQKRDITMEDLNNNDNKVLMIPLFLSERAWAYAMQLKQEANNEPRKKFHLINRLRKAIRFANDLEKLSQSTRCDPRTKLEAQGYSALISGQFHFETQNWKESLNFYNVAKNIYEKLCAALKGDDSQIYYSQKVEEIIPNIRFCLYKLGDKTAQKDLIDMKLKSAIGSELADTIDNLIFQTKEKQVATFSEIDWRNKVTLQVKNEKVKIYLLNVQEYEKQIQASNDLELKVSLYENILKESVDTIQILRDELKLDPNFQTIQRGAVLQPDDKPSNLLLLFSYLTWLRINKTIERNLLMADQLRNVFSKNNQSQLTGGQVDQSSAQKQSSTADEKIKNAKPQDIVRLYDIILQNYKDMSNLPGIIYDKTAQSDVEFLTLFYKAFRAYYISMFYLLNKKYKESVGFSFRVENYVKQIEPRLTGKQTTDLDKNKLDELNKQLTQLKSDLNQSKFKIQTNAILEDDSLDDIYLKQREKDLDREKLEKIPLSERLDIYFEDANNLLNKNPNLVKVALDFEPVQCKPLFFDIALNHVELPSLEDKIDSKRQTAQQQGAGVKGLIKGFFGF